MRERKLGRTDLIVSAIGLGCNNFGARMDFAASERVVHAALDAGVTLFDTADIYGGRGKSEDYLGRALGSRRGEAVIVTKFGLPMSDAARPRNASYDYVLSAAEASLRRLQTDWIDLYMLHRPDAATPIEETLRALDRLVRDGKVRFVGCSNMPAWQIVDAVWAAKTAGLGANYQIMVLPETKTLIDILREGFEADAALPAIGGVKSDVLVGAVSALPAEVRGHAASALRMLKTLEREQVLVAMPAGLVEMHGRAR